MSTLVNPYLAPLAPAEPRHDHIWTEPHHDGPPPPLLEYRGEEDPDEEFIPKTIAGFALGTIVMGICLGLVESLLFSRIIHRDQLMPGMINRIAFMMGITGVASSLLLVGLKVRADHCALQLYARHWLNSLGTGALYAFMVWVPWVFINHSFTMNRFLTAIVGTILLAFPAIAARWIIGPHREFPRPNS